MGWKAPKLIQNSKILIGDNRKTPTVMIIRGKDQGETGLIKRVVRFQNRVIVEGKNCGSQNGAFYLFDFVPAHGTGD